MLPLPPGNEDPRELADWLELNALVGRAKQANLDDMTDGLRTGVLGSSAQELPPQQADRLEGIAASVRAEIQSRVRQAREAYPFRLRGSSLERTITNDRCRSSTYAFCLMLSVTSWEQRRRKGYFPDRIFEEVSCLAAKRYLGGEALRFGWPRVRGVFPRRFDQAVEKLCVRIGEGTGYRNNYATGNEKDAGLDVVAWHPIDERPGKLILFGACATGHNWEQKLVELQPREFCDTYLLGRFALEPSKAFFTPQVMPQEHWWGYSFKAGMLFDRCRISMLVPKLAERDHHGDVREWMEITMDMQARRGSG